MQDAAGTASVPLTPSYQDATAMDIKKVMREKAEAALKHRQREEVKEEVAGRERIRIKIQAMGHTDDKMGKTAGTASVPSTPSDQDATAITTDIKKSDA